MTSKAFWNKEYTKPKHLTMSEEHASDLETFERWALRNAEWPPLPKKGVVLDVGCGNGRNLIYLCGTHDMQGIGIDIAGVALEHAKKMIERIADADPEAKLSPAGPTSSHAIRASLPHSIHQASRGPLTDDDYINQIDPKLAGKKIHATFFAQSAAEKLPAEDQSVDIVLDMMTSHYLRKAEREAYVAELARVTKPYAWLFFKTFVLDGDFHAKRLIEENPDKGDVIAGPDGRIIGNIPAEPHSYIHPRIGVFEHVFTESEIYELFGAYFKVHKMIKSYKHIRDGKPYKRRTISVYMERKRDA